MQPSFPSGQEDGQLIKAVLALIAEWTAQDAEYSRTSSIADELEASSEPVRKLESDPN